MPERKVKGVPAVERALAIFEAVASSGKGLTLSEIARHSGVPKSSAHYILLTLERQGYMSRGGGRPRYAFTPKFFRLTGSAARAQGFGTPGRLRLRRLMESTGLTVHVGVVAEDEVLVVDKIEPSPYRVATWVGKRLAMHCTALGKVLLAWQPEEAVDRVIGHGLTRYNDNTIVSPRKLVQELARIRQLGYAVDDEEEMVGVRCVAVPIRDAGGRVMAALSVSGRTDEITADSLPRLLPQLYAAAAELSRCGGEPWGG